MKQTKKFNLPRILKLTFLLTFVLVEFFGFGFFVFAQTTGVTFTVQVNKTSVTDGDTLRVIPIVSFTTNSTSYPVVIMKTFVNGTQVGNNSNLSLNDMVNGGDYQDIPVSAQNGFKVGQNYIDVNIVGSDGTNFGNQNAPVVTYNSSGNSGSVTCTTDASCASAGTGPNGWNYICNQGKCVEDINLPAGSHCVSNQPEEDCANGAACDATTNTCIVNEYGCQAASTGVWTCSPNQSDPNLTQTCGSSFGLVSPSAKCGCTDAAYNGKTCNNGKTSGGTGASTAQTAAPATGGQTTNSSTTLVNPIPAYSNLTDLLVYIMKGFLGIIAVWAVAFIVIGGFRMVISSGNEEAVLAARKTITWAVLGLLVAVLSFAIIAIVQDLIGVNVTKYTSPTSTIINKTHNEI
jgi:hypothetical protein